MLQQHQKSAHKTGAWQTKSPDSIRTEMSERLNQICDDFGFTPDQVGVDKFTL
jgi:hypothetical protein